MPSAPLPSHTDSPSSSPPNADLITNYTITAVPTNVSASNVTINIDNSTLGFYSGPPGPYQYDAPYTDFLFYTNYTLYVTATTVVGTSPLSNGTLWAEFPYARVRVRGGCGWWVTWRWAVGGTARGSGQGVLGLRRVLMAPVCGCSANGTATRAPLMRNAARPATLATTAMGRSSATTIADHRLDERRAPCQLNSASRPS